MALILQIRRERQYGPLRISFFLERYHNVYVSGHTIHRILKRHHDDHAALRRYLVDAGLLERERGVYRRV